MFENCNICKKTFLAMKKAISFVLLVCFVMLLFACGSNSMAYRRKHGGYDAQTWIPKKHYPYYYNRKAR
jgi:hypothetical protein